ncbi:MAG: large-conductance mechanosensitive channel protein MscL [Chitinophagaceae bacterium]|nr:MAG: Large-conductance mechanosensitive channel [Bacteroidetes bacterium OLB11]MCC6448753.1 large-conductance mechanosensitive channel protein MscL [Chitinophagaceae bacterium]HMN32821.1 large-conductance mechanosensitive channel protein MscL [Chitinophagaceae bacterium]
MSFINEFKEFALKGNVMDMAVGVIIGGAFGKIVSSLVDDMLMPIIGTILGNDFEKLSATINGATVKYGTFIQNVVNFLIIAFVIFLMIKAMNKMKKKQEVVPADPPPPSSTDVLLMEIRDALKK